MFLTQYLINLAVVSFEVTADWKLSLIAHGPLNVYFHFTKSKIYLSRAIGRVFFSCPWVHFSVAPETFWAHEVFHSLSISKNGEVYIYMPETDPQFILRICDKAAL